MKEDLCLKNCERCPVAQGLVVGVAKDDSQVEAVIFAAQHGVFGRTLVEDIFESLGEDNLVPDLTQPGTLAVVETVEHLNKVLQKNTNHTMAKKNVLIQKKVELLERLVAECAGPLELNVSADNEETVMMCRGALAESSQSTTAL
jgi:hypothetical protein